MSWFDFFRKLKKNRLALFGLIIVIILIFAAIFAPLMSPYDPLEQDFAKSFKAPNMHNLLGTDMFGRDNLSRIIYGARASLAVGIIAVGMSVLIGVTLGAIAGYYGGWIDGLLMRVTDVVYAFPFLLFTIAILAFLGPGFTNVFIAIGLISWASYARLIRGQVLSIKQTEYIEAAKAIGVKSPVIILKHVLPNCMAPIIVNATMGVGNAILIEAALSFLGIGVQPPAPSWGLMLSDSRNYIFSAPWLIYWPGAAIAIVVLGFNLFGDGLRDALDPRLNSKE